VSDVRRGENLYDLSLSFLQSVYQKEGGGKKGEAGHSPAEHSVRGGGKGRKEEKKKEKAPPRRNLFFAPSLLRPPPRSPEEREGRRKRGKVP